MKTEITEVIDEDSGLKMKHAVLTIKPENTEDERILQEWQDDNFYIEKYRSGKNIVLMMYCKTEKSIEKEKTDHILKSDPRENLDFIPISEFEEWIEKVEQLEKNVWKLYSFFNNCHQGYAVRNALLFKDLLRKRGRKV